MSDTFYWHDYETWGADPRRDRPCQFAGVRTDADLNEVGDPLVLFCRPSDDLLPHPDACLVTGLTPQRVAREGVVEAEFARAIHAELSRPGTCGVGYNSLRFDDEVTRHLFYRNFFDPYAREWRSGNSRWDLIDVLRLAHALRPEGIEWPLNDEGTTSFRLEQLTVANGIDHGQAHDALADVRATIALARRLRDIQPRLFSYALTLRDKRRVRALLDERRPLLHVSARFPAALGCIAPICPVAAHPTNSNGVICFDLRADPSQLLELSVEEIRRRLFTPSEDLPAGVERVPLKTVHVNHVPMLAPLATLTPERAERWSIDPARVVRHAQWIAASSIAIESRVRAVHERPLPVETDPELMLYSGGFLSDADRRACDQVVRSNPAELATAPPRFSDPRLGTLLFRYRARNWPETLTPEEREDWDAYRFMRLTDPDGGASLQIEGYEARLAELAGVHDDDPARLAILDALGDWAEQVLDAG
ncbi:exodeoxyribonuclease I [Allochromatium vinosum]|uniref:Exodeoxyribonuclease I n=1 Tax=Allochromatium vinosum (strain ATCC 17899 / DSM 180 / NBRC 103801 / NCIMB 10441 / D) TaxID=572477 RepID=D3RNM8_ALLVD|nr:exodeoxyribonuclease I [Allochromatium vinosum]ADC63393.1 Exodeoxyribonuclease I [Allochromatium vinosum DSM 180]MBK1654038.1 exodeoxyribonuclease I [Allochromatium vinosum]